MSAARRTARSLRRLEPFRGAVASAAEPDQMVHDHQAFPVEGHDSDAVFLRAVGVIVKIIS